MAENEARKRLAEYLCSRDADANGPGLTWEDFTDEADEIIALLDPDWQPPPETAPQPPPEDLLTGNEIAAKLHEIARNRRPQSDR